MSIIKRGMATKLKIKFIDVGRGKANWTAECPNAFVDAYEWLYKQVKPHLLSDNLEFYLEENGKNGKSGVIYAGFRCVGHFELICEGADE